MSISPRTLRPSSNFSPRSISGLSLWLDASSDTLYTTDAGPVVAVASPLDIAGCVGWYDASDSATLFDAQSGGSAVTTNGATVARWQDKSGGGRHLTQSTANTGLPTLTTNALGGRNVVAFGGTGTGAGFTMTTPVSRATHTVLAVYVSETGGDTSGAIINDGSAGYGLLVTRGAGTNLEASSGNATLGGGRILANLSGSTTATIGPGISSWLHAGTPSVFQNGASIGSGTTSGSVSLSRVGYYAVSSTIFRLKGYIAELVIFDNALSASQRASVEAYLAAKWSIAGVHAPATASSDPVGYWGDKSGNGRHVTTSDASTRPVIHSATHNGRKVLDFDGANDTLSRDNYTAESGLTGLTRFGVFYVDAGAGAMHVSSVYNGGSYSSFTSASSLLGTHAGLSSTSRHDSVGNILTSGTSPRVFCARYDGTAGSFATGLNIIMDGVTLPVASTSGTFPSSLPGGSPSLFIGSNIRANNWLNGKLCEYISYARALTTAERQRIERYLATRWGITLAPQVSNADAQDWINRVYANGGTVSAATAGAVNQFCVDIENALVGSIRDRFYRLNLFCGTGLNAALVPLYRGPSLGGTQYGNATDTNNAFGGVGIDYAETGAGGGLLGNGSTKFLTLGTMAQLKPSWTTHHFGLDIKDGYPDATNRYQMGAFFNETPTSPRGAYGISGTSSTGRGDSGIPTRAGFTSSTNLKMVVRESSTDMRLFEDGTQVGTTQATADTATVLPGGQFVVGASSYQNVSGGTPTSIVNGYAPAVGTLRGYSIGEGINSTQRAAFVSAWSAFRTALGRA